MVARFFALRQVTGYCGYPGLPDSGPSPSRPKPWQETVNKSQPLVHQLGYAGLEAIIWSAWCPIRDNITTEYFTLDVLGRGTVYFSDPEGAEAFHFHRPDVIV